MRSQALQQARYPGQSGGVKCAWKRFRHRAVYHEILPLQEVEKELASLEYRPRAQCLQQRPRARRIGSS
jgi:hypothetical protein